MTTTKTAQNILDENNYTTAECGLTDLEGLMDVAIAHINSVAGQSIAALTGVAGSKTTGALTDAQLSAFYPLTVMLLRAHIDRGPNSSLGPMSTSTVINDPQYTTYKILFEQAIATLTGVGTVYVARSFQRA